MVEQFDTLSEAIITAQQKSLKLIRQALELGVQEFADYIGVTRQTINNLETQKTQMSVTQFVAICAVIDYFLKKKPKLKQIVYPLLQTNEETSVDFVHLMDKSDSSLLMRWFALFDDSLNSDEFKSVSGAWNEFGIDNTSNAEPTHGPSFTYLVVENCRIFFDDSVLICPHLTSRIEPLFKLLEENRKKIIIPKRAIDSVYMGKAAGKDFYSNGVNVLEQMNNRNILEIRGDKNDGSVAATLMSVFAKFKSQYRLVLFTQDTALASQICTLNGNVISGYDIEVYVLDTNGELLLWGSDPTTEPSQSFVGVSDDTNTDTENTDTFYGWGSI